MLYGRVLLQRAGDAQHLLGQHRRPVPQADGLGADVRHRHDGRGAGRRPHRLPADPGRQPAGLQRQPDDRPRHARPAAGDPRPAAASSWSSTRGAPGPPRRPTSTTSSVPAPTRCCCSRSSHVAVRRGPGRPRRADRRAAAPASTRSARWPSRSRPEAVAPVCGIEAEEIRRMARELAAAPTRRRLRADRDLHPGVRDAGQLAGRRAQRADRQPRPRGRGDVPARRRRRTPTRPVSPGAGAASRFGRFTSRVRGLPRALRRAPGRPAWPRRSTPPARARCGR